MLFAQCQRISYFFLGGNLLSGKHENEIIAIAVRHRRFYFFSCKSYLSEGVTADKRDFFSVLRDGDGVP